MTDYPRPDFVRPDLNWESLNGPWSFLFDDNDIGLAQKWHLRGLPDQVTVDAAPSEIKSLHDEAQSITAKIAAGTQELIQGNQYKKDNVTTHKKRNIQVPYVFQCPASGVEDRGVHEVLWYEREMTDLRTAAQKDAGNCLLLRFGAVDYEVEVWCNGHFVGGHRGGHVPFDIDVSDTFEHDQRQRLTLRVYDSAYDLTQPRGKQYWGAQPESIFYTPSSGIWQSVWLEVVPPARIGDASTGTVLQSNDIENGTLHASVRVMGRRAGYGYSVELEASLGGVVVSKTDKVDLTRESDVVSFDANMRLSDSQLSQLPSSLTDTAPLGDAACWLNGVALWSPEHPTLYDLTIRLYSAESTLLDTIHTTTGMRALSWTDGLFRLNHRPYFQALFLDQGYWPETFMTPPSSLALKTDIELAKSMGFNGCRKHQKVEDPAFHFWADRLGFLVWGEMANAYAFSAAYTARFDAEWRAAVRRDINHASVVAWTPVNESWAYTDLTNNARHRDHVRSLYYATKTLDPTRPVNDNCGWEHVVTDLTTFHDYADADALAATCASLPRILGPKAGRGMFVEGAAHVDGAPVICTEFGGVNIARETAAQGGSGSANRDWGYTTASDPVDLLARLETMMKGIVEGGLIGGFVYTQLTDIEQEVNGLFTPERREKLDALAVRRIVEGVREKYALMHGEKSA